MKMKTWFAFTLSLVLACCGSSGLAQSTNDAGAAPAPADSGTKPPPASKSSKKSTKKAPAKTAKAQPAKPLEAQSLSPGPAVVTEKNVNVRGQPAIGSEVVAHLKRGDHIQVLEEVTLKKPKADEPAKWAKIALPTNAPVWVNATFLDPNKTVIPKKLNLRSGPGENYSVIGHFAKGTVVKEIESKGDWIRIEAPADSYAFVAAHLISNEAPSTPVLASTEVPKPPPTTAPPFVASPVVQAPPPVPPTETTIVENKPPPVVGAEPAGGTPPPPPTIVAAPPTPPATAVKPPVEPPAPIIAVPPPKPEPPDEDVKRIITREGIVKRSVSIQAPTYFVLESVENGKTINYLFSTNLVLRDYKGQRVMVTGEEMLDERWPNVPVITIDKLETVP